MQNIKQLLILVAILTASLSSCKKALSPNGALDLIKQKNYEKLNGAYQRGEIGSLDYVIALSASHDPEGWQAISAFATDRDPVIRGYVLKASKNVSAEVTIPTLKSMRKAATERGDIAESNAIDVILRESK